MNKYERIFKAECEGVDKTYELKKANIIITDLIEQRNSLLNEITMVRAECALLNEKLRKTEEEGKEKEEKESTEDTNAD